VDPRSHRKPPVQPAQLALIIGSAAIGQAIVLIEFIRWKLGLIVLPWLVTGLP
jgi:hypothetical protein